MPIMCFGGFFVNLRRIAPALSFMKYVSWHRYAFEIQMINRWEGEDKVDCKFSFKSVKFYFYFIFSDCDKFAEFNEKGACDWGYDGPTILDFFAFGGENGKNGYPWMLRNFGILIFMIVLFRTVAVSALFIRARLIR